MPNYPASLDAIANPTGATNQNDAGFLHSVQHGTANDILEILEAKLGITDAPASNAPLANRALVSLADGKSGWGQVISAMLAANAATHLWPGPTGSAAYTLGTPGVWTYTGVSSSLSGLTAGSPVLYILTGTANHSAAGGSMNIGVGIDTTAAPSASAFISAPGAGLYTQFIVVGTMVAAPGGSTFYEIVNVSAGTYTRAAAPRLIVLELLK